MMEHISKNQIKLIRSLQHKKFRNETGLFVAEGKKCIEDLSKVFELKILVTPDNATNKEIEQMSSLKNPQGTIGVFEAKKYELPTVQIGRIESSKQIILALDSVQDPGNLGTIIRTADWFGISDIVCSRNTADCYNPKVVQATMGSLARVRVHYTDLQQWLKAENEKQVPIYGTLLNGKNIYQQTLQNCCIIIMGNEGNGISEQIKECITHPITIPPFRQGEHAESLNVGIATAIVISEFMRN